MYYNENTDEFISEEHFKEIAKEYIENHEWENGNEPSIKEVMLNMDWIHKSKCKSTNK